MKHNNFIRIIDSIQDRLFLLTNLSWPQEDALLCQKLISISEELSISLCNEFARQLSECRANKKPINLALDLINYQQYIDGLIKNLAPLKNNLPPKEIELWQVIIDYFTKQKTITISEEIEYLFLDAKILELTVDKEL